VLSGLVRGRPRAQWKAHPKARPLAKFWMDHHIAVRRMAATSIDWTETRLDDRIVYRALPAQVSRLGGGFAIATPGPPCCTHSGRARRHQEDRRTDRPSLHVMLGGKYRGVRPHDPSIATPDTAKGTTAPSGLPDGLCVR